MKKLFKYLKQNKILLSLSFICAIIAVFSSLSAPIFVGKAVDSMTSKGNVDFKALIKFIIILTIIYVVGAIVTWVLTYLTNGISYKTANSLRNDLFSKLNKLPIKFYDNNAHGDVISRFINDVDAITDGMLQGIGAILTGIITILGAICFMYLINPIMSIVVIISAPFTYLIAKFITKNSQKLFKAKAQKFGELNGYVEEIITGQKTVKVFNYEETSIKKFKEINQELYKVGVKSQFFGALTNPSTRLVNNITFSIIGIVGSVMAIQGKITIGDISSFLIYSSLFSKPINEITGVLTQIQAAIASSTRVFEIIELEEEKNEAFNLKELKNCKGAVEFKNVVFSYTPNNKTIKNLNLKVMPGKSVAIVGKTGCGKTTLVNLLMRFYEVSSGTISIDGINITDISRESLRKSFGMVLQETYVFTETIANNIAYGSVNVTREKIIETAKKTGAHSFIRRLPKGYDTVINGGGDGLSKGQEQLLTITRVMLLDPPMLILDEATSNIDTRLELNIQKAFEKIMEGRTSFIIAHRLSTIKEADVIVVMDKGNIVEQGTHDELLLLHGYYEKLYNKEEI